MKSYVVEKGAAGEGGGFHKREAGKKAQGVEETGKEGKATSGMDSCSTGDF